ncbi:hypothetical protein HIM_00597 [Hirsutella minnesotensis 3608]|nr:hypothetical protein HIM_00597 [Hirsutella minnesotensis 3608]
MSDTEANGKPLPWTEETKIQLLLRIVAQFRDNGGKQINWSKIQMEGRTTKSLKGMWTKINKEISDLEAAQNEGTPIKPKTPVKRDRKKAADKPVEDAETLTVGGENGAMDEGDSPKATPKKRGPTPRAKAPKKVKKSESEEEGSANANDEKLMDDGEI